MIEVWLKLFVDADGRTIVTMNERPIANANALSEQLRALVELEPDTPVILDIAPDVPMRDVVQVDDVCRAAGCQSINFSARAEDVLRPDPTGRR